MERNEIEERLTSRKHDPGSISFRPGYAVPMHLEGKVQAYLSTVASKKGVDLFDLVNEVLKNDIELSNGS